MTALVRSLIQLLLARLLATGTGAALISLLATAGISEEDLVNYATVVAFGFMVQMGRILGSLPAGEMLAKWWNLIVSAGTSRDNPSYISPVAVEVAELITGEGAPV